MYKYLCIKDFWMRGQSAEYGDTPAFKAGEVYLFQYEDSDQPEWFVTDNNHNGEVHYLDLNDIDEYFQLRENVE